MKRVIIESPYAGDVARNMAYAREAMLDSLRRGEAPFASHLLYTQCLDDLKLEERALGISAGFAWGIVADLVVLYVDYGISSGMSRGLCEAVMNGKPVEYRWRRGMDRVFDTGDECPDRFAKQARR